MQVVPSFHFSGACEEAIQLYRQAFGAELRFLMHYRDANPADMDVTSLSEEEKGLVYHAELFIGGQRFMASDTPEAVPQGQNMSITLIFDTPDDVRAAYEVLSPGASIVYPLQETTYSSCFAALVDRFGMRWGLMTETF